MITKLLSRDEKIARLKQIANEHDKEITAKDKRINEIEAKDSAKGFEITNLRDILASRDQIVSFREAHIDRLVAEQISKNEDIRVKDKELQMKDEMIAAKEEEIAALGSICNNQGGNLLESEHEIASLKDTMTLRDKEITNLKQTLSLRLNVSERAITRLETNLKDKHEDVAKMEIMLAARDVELASKDKQIASFAFKESYITRLQANLVDKRKEIADKDTLIATRDGNIKSLIKDLGIKDHEIARLRDELASKDKAITQREEDIASLTANLENKNKEITTRDDDIAGLRDKIALKDKAITLREDYIGNLQVDLKSKSQLIIEKEEEIESYTSRENYIALLKEKDANAEIGEWNNLVAKRNDEIVCLKDDLATSKDELENVINRLRCDLRNKDEDINCKDQKIASLSAAKVSNSPSIKVNIDHISLGGKQKKSRWGAITQEPKHEIASLKNKLALRDGEITKLKQTLGLRLKALNETVVFQDIKMKQKEITSLKDELATLQAKLNNISHIHSPPRKRQCTDQSPIQSNKVLTMKLGQEHTSCSICLSKYSTDTKNKDNNITKHLPVLSASSKSCDHCFCHGCILKQQASIAEESGRIPKWIPCMICRTKTAFCPSEPKYHRVLIDILKQARWTDMAEVKEEQIKTLSFNKEVFEVGTVEEVQGCHF